jgi:type I restriction enzyme S subunit
MIKEKILPNEWKLTKMEEVCDIISGKNQSKVINPKGKYPIYGSSGIFGFADEYLCNEGTTVIGRKGTINSPQFVKTKFWNVDTAFGLSPKENYDNKLLYYFCLSFNFHKLDKSTTIPSLAKRDLLSIDIPLPPKPTQQAIVSKIEELFSELDKGIENLHAAQQQLKTYRQSVLKWAFEGKLTNENVNVKDGELPKGWKKIVLGDVCKNVEYGSATKSKIEGKVPVLRMGNIQNGKFDWEDLVYTNDDEEIKKYLLKKDDVLFNRTNSAEWVGKTAIYKGERPAIFAGYLIRINRIGDLLDANFITYFLNSLDAKKYGNSVRSFGVNQSNINGTKLKSYPLSLPPLKEQEKIVEEIESRLSVADKMEESITQSLQQAEALRQSILKKAFEGELL